MSHRFCAISADDIELVEEHCRDLEEFAAEAVDREAAEVAAGDAAAIRRLLAACTNGGNA